MQHLGDFHKIRESRLLAADPHHLGRSHHELLLLSRNHFRIFIPHDGEDSLQKLIILVVTIRIFPWICIFIFILLILSAVIQVIKILSSSLLSAFLLFPEIFQINIVVIGFRESFLYIVQIFQTFPLLFLLFLAKTLQINVIDVSTVFSVKGYFLLLLLLLGGSLLLIRCWGGLLLSNSFQD